LHARKKKMMKGEVKEVESEWHGEGERGKKISKVFREIATAHLRA
jgi:hypothetical protein